MSDGNFEFKIVSFPVTDEQEIICYVESLETEVKSCHEALAVIARVTQDYASATSAEENIE